MEKKPRILLVENDRDFGRYVARSLQERGYGVIFYENMAEAAKGIKSGDKYDIAFISSFMPNSNHDEVAAVSKKFNPDIKVVSFTVDEVKEPWADANFNKCTIGYIGIERLESKIKDLMAK
jgi:CheY-like chemotaxis protein